VSFVRLTGAILAILASGACCLTSDIRISGDAGTDAGAIDSGPDAGDAGEPVDDGGCLSGRICDGVCLCHGSECRPGCVPTFTIALCPISTDAGCSYWTCLDTTQDDDNCGGCGNVCDAGSHCAAPTGGNGICVPDP
jgi:hypothetical protein